VTRRNLADTDRSQLPVWALWIANHQFAYVAVGTALAVASFLVSTTPMPYWIGAVFGIAGFTVLSSVLAAYAVAEVRRRWYFMCAAGVAVGGVLFVLPGTIRPQGSLYGVAAFSALAFAFAWWRAHRGSQP
jgi:hypothetical protein